MSGYFKDISRTIKRNIKRLMAIAIMVMLGIGLFVGIPAACDSALYSAGKFYEQAKLFDIRVVSTLGLTGEDADVLGMIEGVAYVSRGFSKSVKTEIRDKDISVSVIMLPDTGMNVPLVLEGRLPEKGGEIAVERGYLRASGKTIGDKLTLITDKKNKDENKSGEADDEDEFGIPDGTEPDTPGFRYEEYIITASVLSPTRTATAFNDNTGSDAYLFYVDPSCVDTDVYTDIYIGMIMTDDLNCYDSGYKLIIDRITDYINLNIKSPRIEARYNEITSKALGEVYDAEKKLREKREEAEAEIADGEEKIAEGLEKIAEGEEEIADGWRKFYNNRKKLSDALAEIKKGEEELNDARDKLVSGEAEYERGKKELNKQSKQLDELWQAVGLLEYMIPALGGMLPEPEDTGEFIYISYGIIETANGAAVIMMMEDPATAQEILNLIGDAITALNEGEWEAAYNSLNCLDRTSIILAMESAKRKVDYGKAELARAKKELDNGWAALSAGEIKLAEGKAEAEDGLRQLYDAEIKLKEADEEIKEAKAEITVNEKELAENKEEFYKKITDAEQKIADARAEIAKIAYPKWYVLDRSSIDSFERLSNDVNSIKAVGSAFPVIFLIVAVAVCLTSMTRLVEEERSIAGTYSAIGYSGVMISLKYIVFAVLACVIGGALGGALGYMFFPKAIWGILMMLHDYPEFTQNFDLSFLIYGVLIYAASLVSAAAFACKRELKSKPSELLRPKPPAMGARILLERVTPLWRRMKFLSKVTARNLFRYKKRMFMTVFGITGCTALIVTGFAIKNSALGLVSSQYDSVTIYDMIAVYDPDKEGAADDLAYKMSRDERVDKFLPAGINAVSLMNLSGDSIGLQMITVLETENIEDYVRLRNENALKRQFPEQGIAVTENAAKILNVREGDEVIIKKADSVECQVIVASIVHNYLGNFIYISGEYGEKSNVGTDMNAYFIINSAGLSTEEATELRRELLRDNSVLSITDVNNIKRDITNSMEIVDMVVYLLIAMAACLAFVVLYTLANINISERRRELATIKVLGFFDREIYRYVNRETMILVVVGVVLGLPAGRGIGEFIVSTIKMPSISIHIDILPVSYIAAAALTALFAVITNAFSNRTLKKLNMTESLKSVE